MAARQKESMKDQDVPHQNDIVSSDAGKNIAPARSPVTAPARGAPHTSTSVSNSSNNAADDKITDIQCARTSQNILDKKDKTIDINNSNSEKCFENEKSKSAKDTIDFTNDMHFTNDREKTVDTGSGKARADTSDADRESLLTSDVVENDTTVKARDRNTDNTEEINNQHIIDDYIYTDDEDDEYIDVSNNGDSGDESDVEDNDEISFPIKRRLSNPELPETVTCLETPSGCKVYVIGTAHFSLESQEDVAKTIEATQPDVIVLELCSSRVNILQLDEKTLLEEAKNISLEKLRATIKQSGVMQGVMHVLFLNMSAHVTKQLGMAPGGEFRRAFREGQKVPGCRLHLGDRPIQITLRRALSSLSWWQHLKLCWYLLTSKDPISKEDVEKCKQKDLLEQMLKEMTGEFPALSQVFVDERDLFLTHSLKVASNRFQSRLSPTGFVEPKVVVGVVGIGHVPGIKNNWDQNINIEEIMKIPPRSTVGKVLKWGFKASVVGILIYGCYRVYRFATPLIF